MQRESRMTHLLSVRVSQRSLKTKPLTDQILPTLILENRLEILASISKPSGERVSSSRLRVVPPGSSNRGFFVLLIVPLGGSALLSLLTRVCRRAVRDKGLGS